MKKFALLVGVSEYRQQGIDNLPNSVNDIDAVQNVLKDSQFGAFNEVKCLKNPTKSALERAVNYLFTNRQPDDLVLFYFSGHGMRDRQFDLHFGLSATELDEKKVVRSFSAYRAGEMHREMNSSRSERQVIILDCCFSGAFTKDLKVKGDEETVLEIKPDELGGKGRAILTSSAATKYSFARENSELSLYTHYLVEGIRSGAADRDNDGWIGVDELFEYTSEKVTQESSAMTPQFYPVKEGYKILLARSPQDDPELRYRKQVIEIIRAEHEDIDFIAGEFDPIDRDTLDLLGQELGLEAEVAAAIEQAEMQPYRLKQEKLNQFQATYEKAVKRHGKLTEQQLRKLRRNQARLGLQDQDVAQWLSVEVPEVIQTATPKPSATPEPEPSKKQDKLPKTLIEDLGNGVKLEMVLIPQGHFLIANTDEKVERLIEEFHQEFDKISEFDFNFDRGLFNKRKAPHRIEIIQPFYFGKYQITQGQWQAVMGKNSSEFPEGDNYPIQGVSLYDCHVFLNELNRVTNKQYCLPNESEWEYACQAGSTSRYFFGDDAGQLRNYAWFRDNSGGHTHPVGEKQPNNFGLFDLYGNVWEWCENSFEANDNTSSTQKPFGNSSNHKALRGGSWDDDPENCLSALRDDFSRMFRGNNFGFRVVCSPPVMP